MKLYLVGRKYIGTQAEAKSAAKTTGGSFEPVDVPTDKEGLIGYLNALSGNSPAPTLQQKMEALAATAERPSVLSHTEKSVAIDDAWDELPLARKLHFAADAMEAARDALGDTPAFAEPVGQVVDTPKEIDHRGIVDTPEDDEVDPFS